MKIRLTARNVALPERLRVHVRRRLALALGRFGERIEKVSVRFTDTGTDALAVPGPSQKHCRIEVGLRPRAVSVEDADADPFAAADSATDRLSRSVARALDRERDEGQRASPGLRGSKP
jgi:ribosomal subunit interface protein